METAMPAASQPAQLSNDERAAILARNVADHTRIGWRVISQTPTQAQLVKGKPTSHVLHLILTIFTAGLWALVWIGLAIFAGEKQKFVSVDEYGRVSQR